MARKISELDAASTPDGGEGLAGIQAGATKRFHLGTHLPYLDATGKILSQFLPTLTGIGDMLKSTYDAANKAGQMLVTADILDEDDFVSDSAAKVPSQQSAKAYITTAISAAVADLLADLADATEELGAALVGYFNPGGTKFGGATTLLGILDWIWSNGLWSDGAEDAIPATALASGDAVALFRADGTVASMDVNLFKGGGSDTAFVEYSGTSYPITTADKGRRIFALGAADSTVVLPLHANHPYDKGQGFKVYSDGIGLPKITCSTAAIVVNGASNGEVALPNRTSEIEAVNTGPDRWKVISSATTTTADTTPPAIVSISPVPGTTLLPDQAIEITWSEPIQPGGVGKTVTQRKDTGTGYADDGTYDMDDPLGTDPGEINIIGNKTYIYPPASRTEGANYAYRMSAGALKDLASSPNDCAAVAADNVVGPWTVPESSVSGIEVIHSEGWSLQQGSVVGSTHTRTLSAAPATGDMVIAFSACVGQILAGIPAGMTTIFDQTAASNPGCFMARRVEGVTPSDQIAFKTVSNRRQAAGALILRGTGLTVSVGNGTGNASGSTSPKALALAQDTANELRIIAAMVDARDLDATTTALEAAGWTPRIEQTTGLGSATEGATLVVATRAQGGADNESIDPPAWSIPNSAAWRAFHVGIKQV